MGGWDGGPAGDPTLLTIRPPFFVVKKTIPPDLQEQLKTLKALTKEVRQERAKVSKGGSTRFAFESQQSHFALVFR